MVAEKSNRRLFEERDPGSGRRGEKGREVGTNGMRRRPGRPKKRK